MTERDELTGRLRDVEGQLSGLTAQHRSDGERLQHCESELAAARDRVRAMEEAAQKLEDNLVSNGF